MKEEIEKEIRETLVVINPKGMPFAVNRINSLIEKELTSFAKWITDKNCKYSIMYGGTPELDKDYRFCTTDEDYTIEEVISDYRKIK